MFMGGCSGQKKQMEAAQAESAELRERVATLDQANRDKDGKIAELQTALSNCQTQLAAKPVMADPGAGGDVADAKKTGGSSDFTRDSEGQMRARLSGDVLFDPGQATLKSSAKKSLDRIASEIKSQYRNDSIRVEGHTDSDPIRKAKFASNQALSEARAESVRKYLISKGVSSGRIDAVGYGSSKPKSSKAASRRVEIVILN